MNMKKCNLSHNGVNDVELCDQCTDDLRVSNTTLYNSVIKPMLENVVKGMNDALKPQKDETDILPEGHNDAVRKYGRSQKDQSYHQKRIADALDKIAAASSLHKEGYTKVEGLSLNDMDCIRELIDNKDDIIRFLTEYSFRK